MRVCPLCACAAILLTILTARSAPDDRAPGAEIFDFSDLDVVEKAGEKLPPEAKPEKPAPPPPALPAEAATVIQKLAHYQHVKESVLTARIVEARKMASQKLMSAVALADGAGREKLEQAAFRCNALPAGERLAHPVPAASFRMMSTWTIQGKYPRTLELDGRLTINGAQRGHWYWVDEEKGLAVYDYWGGDVCDFIRLTTSGAEYLSNHGEKGSLIRQERPELKHSDEAARTLAATAMQEVRWRHLFEADIAGKRRRVHDWLLSLVRTTSGAPGISLLNEAVKLETKPVPGQPRENPDRVAGTWVSEKGRRFEFHPDGPVSVNGAANAGTWSWAKARNWNTMLVVLPGIKTKEIFFARLASSEPGKLRIYAYGTPNGSLTRQ